MAADDVIVGIDPSAAKAGSKEVVAQLEKIATAAGSVSKRAGKRIDTLYAKIQKLSGVASVSATKIASINNLAQAMANLSGSKGPSAAMVRNVGAFFRVMANARVPGNLNALVGITRTLGAFRGPSAVAVTNVRNLFAALSKLPNTAGLQKMLSDLRLITARLGPVAAALTRLQGAGGAAAGGLRRAGQAARSTHADFIGLRASSLSLGGALLRTGEFAGALGAAFGLRAVATEIGTMQKTEAGLMAVTGSMAASRKEMEFLMQTARTFKVYVGDLSLGYSQFRVASEGLGLSVAETQGVFRDITQSVRVFNLSTDDAGGVFRALTQIASKGSLQMEELRGQLGDRMPVAVQAMANALGVSTGALAKMMEQGQVTGDVLRRGMIGFGKEVARMTDAGLEQATQTLGASMGDLKTTFYEFANALGNAGVTEMLRNVATTLNAVMQEGHPANNIMNMMAQSAAFLSRNLHLIGVAIAAMGISKLVPMISGWSAAMTAATQATALNSVATKANTDAKVGLFTSLAILGSAKTKDAGLTLLATTATQKNTLADLAAARGKNALTVATNLAVGSLRALWMVMAAHPLTMLLVAVTAVISIFTFFKDKLDSTRVATQLLQDATANAANEAHTAVTSVAALAAEYRDLELAALGAARQMGITAQNRAVNQRSTAMENIRSSGRNFYEIGNMEVVGAIGRVSGASDSTPQQRVRDRELLRREGTASRARVSRGLGTDNDKKFFASWGEILSGLGTIEQSIGTYGREEVRSVADSARVEAARRGLKGEESGKFITEQTRETALRYGIPLAEPSASSTIAAASEAAGGGAGKKGRTGKSPAEREMEQQQKAAEQLISSLDRVYDARAKLQGSLAAMAHIDPKLFDDKTVSQVELVRRAINEAYSDVSKFDVASNLETEWGDAVRMVGDYRRALESAGVEAGVLADRAAALARLEFASNYSDALGPIGSMATLVSDTERKLQQMQAASERLGLSEAGRQMAVEAIADEYARSVREIVRSTRAGARLTKQFEDAAATIEDMSSVIADAFGSNSADGLRLSLADARREAEGLYDFLPRLSVSTGPRDMGTTIATGISTAVSDGVATVPDVVVQGVRNGRVSFFESGGTIGGEMARAAINRVKDAMDDIARLTSEKAVAISKTIADVVSQGGLVGDMEEYGAAIAQVQTRIASFSGSNTELAQQRYLLNQLTYASEQMRASYYTAALEGTKMGGVLSRGIDEAADALSNFISTGTLDMASFLRGIQADFIKTFAITPLMNGLKTMVGNRLGVAPPEQAQGVFKGATGSDQMIVNALSKMDAARAQLAVREEAIMVELGTHVANFGRAVSSMPGAGAIGTFATTTGAALGGTGAPAPGSVTGAVNGGPVQPSPAGVDMLDRAAPVLADASSQMLTSAVGLTGVAGQFANMILPNFLQGVMSQIFGAGATQVAAGAQQVAATTTGVSLNAAASALMAAAGALTASAYASSATSLFPGMHSGGIVGKASQSIRTSASAFSSAPRYHVGGIAGLKPGEIPTVLKKGEEILTEQNPRHIGNFFNSRLSSGGGSDAEIYQHTTNQNNNISINIAGSAGTPEQNDDLANKAAAAVEKVLTGKVRGTMNKRQRASNMKVK